MPTRERPMVGGLPWPDRRLSRRVLATDAASAARLLIGCGLVRRLDDGQILAGRIVETEAYLGVRDRASHAFGGRRTPRNEAMYGPPGTAYVYFTYGMHHCFNVVCGREGEPAAVLIRALEPIEGIAQMLDHRRRGSEAAADLPLRDLCRGPGRLCRALAIGPPLNGADLLRGEHLWLAGPISPPGPTSENRVIRTARIGVDYAGAWSRRRLRWVIAGHPCASGPACLLRAAASPRPAHRR